MMTWSWEPSLLVSLFGQVGTYLACVGPLRHFFPGATAVSRGRIVAFLLGSFTLFIALVSPLGTLSDGYLFSAHMTQHVLLALIAPPLLLLGTPRWLFRPFVMTRLGLKLGRVLTHPVVAYLLFNLTFLLWHIPAYYDAALRNEYIHIVQHVAYIGTATLMWWPIFGVPDELPRLSEPAQCLYLFFMVIPSGLLGAMLTFSNTVLYPTYANAPRIWDMSALQDQKVAGLIMWMPAKLIFLAVLTVVFFRFMNRDDDEVIEVYETV